MQTKSSHKIFIAIILLNSILQVHAQSDSLNLITYLASDKYVNVSYALNTIIDDSLAEYIPYLEQNIFNQRRENFTEDWLLALNRLKSPNVIEIAKAYIDSASYLGFYDTLEAQLTAVAVLFNNRDYTRVQYLFDFIDREYPCLGRKAGLTLTLLANLIEYNPSNSAQAKATIINISKNCSDDITGTLALQLLHHYYGTELVDHYLDRFINDQDDFIRLRSMEYLFKANYPQLNEILLQRLKTDANWSNRTDIGDSLLYVFGKPRDFKAVREWIVLEQNETARELFYMAIEEIQPHPPKSLSNIFEYLDYFSSLCDTLQVYNWIGNTNFSGELKTVIQSAKTNLQTGDSLACRVQVKAFQDLVDNVYKDSLNTDPRFVTIEGWKFLYWNAQYILDRLPEPPANPNLLVNLKNSLGNQIPASNVKYYEGSWKDAVNNGDGTFTVITIRPIVSIRVFYEYASQQIDNVPAQNNTYTFATVNAVVQLKNSLGNLIDAGTVQYYAGSWRSFGTTTNGITYKELLPINYSFRMTYEYGSIDKQQNLSTDPTVVFQTVNAAVQLKNSLGSLIDVGTVQYYAGAWRTFGKTSNGVAYKELLPVNYSFRMTYEFVSNDKQQNLSTNPVVDFNTVLCSVKVSKTSNNEPINNADVKYYSGAWRNLGTTNSDGIATKELLPANLSFRATLGSVSLDKQQDISVNSLVEILLNVP